MARIALVNQLVALLQSEAPCAITTADLLHPSAPARPAETRCCSGAGSGCTTIADIQTTADRVLNKNQEICRRLV